MNNQNSNIRRIDELGRLVIPKDIRKKLHIKDNEPLEVYIDGETIKIKKYSSLPDIIEEIKELLYIGSRITGNSYFVTDREKIIASTDKGKVGKTLSKELESFVISGLEIKCEKRSLKLEEPNSIDATITIMPILIEGDRSGIIVEYNEDKSLSDDKIVKIFKFLIEKKLNNY